MAPSASDPNPRVFLSYRHSAANLSVVRRLLAALEAEGLSVWFDENEIDAFDDVTDAIRNGVRGAHALVAYYDENYTGRRACQWELTEALIAGAGGAAHRRKHGRVFVVTPTSELDHVRPRALRRTLMLSWADQEPSEIARAVRFCVERLRSTIGKARRPRAQPWVGVAERAAYARFVGRTKEMWAIFDALSEDVVILHGRVAAPRGGSGRAHLHAWGGVGKSLLAAEYARRFSPFYPGGVFWLRAGVHSEDWRSAIVGALRDVATGLTMDLRAFDERLRGSGDVAAVLREARALIGQMLATRRRSYLWIVDDLPEGASLDERDAWAAPDDEGLGRTLFTTRDSAGFETGVAIAIGMLDEASAYELLTFARKPETSEETSAACGFLEVVDRYALIVDVAGRLVGSGYFPSFAALMRTASHPELDARVLDLEDGLRLDLPGGANPNILATLLRSFDFLASLSAGALALDVLRFASCLQPNQPIPHDWLEEALGQDCAAARHHLSDLALADVGARGITVHPVICRAVALSSPPERIAELRARAVASLTPRLHHADEVEHLRAAEGLVSHALVLLAEAADLQDAILLGRVAGHHYIAGRGALAETLYRRQLGMLEAVFNDHDHQDLLTCRANLAGALRAQGKNEEALQLQRQVLDRSRVSLAAEHPDTLMALNNYAETMRATGDLDTALKLHHEALEARRRLFGDEDSATLTSQSNLAGVRHARGELEEALVLRRKILAILSRDEKSFATFVAKSNLAETLRALDRASEAHALQLDVIAGFRQLLGEEHPDTLTARNNFALINSALGSLDEAKEDLQWLVDARERILGASHPETLISKLNLAATLSDLNQREKALALAEQAARTLERTLGPDHPVTLNAVDVLGAILHRTGEDNETARVLLERAMNGRMKVLGPKHYATLTSMTNLAGVLMDQNDLVAACDRYREATDGFMATLGASHASTRVAMSSYALTLQELGKFAAARDVYERLMAFQSQFLGEAHRDTLNTMSELALTHYLLEDRKSARRLYERAVEISRRAYGETDLGALIFMSNLAGLLDEIGEPAAAAPLREKVVAARLQSFGLSDASTIASMNQLAQTLWRLNEQSRAKSLWVQALPAAMKVLGGQHEVTVAIRRGLEQQV